MSNFIELHDSKNSEPIFINMDVIECMVRNNFYTELAGVKHWCNYHVLEDIPTIFEKMRKGGD